MVKLFGMDDYAAIGRMYKIYHRSEFSNRTSGLVDGATGPGGPGSARPNLLGFVREVSELAAANPLLYDLGLRLSTGTQARAEGVADGEVSD